MQGRIEAERKYALARGQELPSLASVAVEGPAEEFELDATYYDAPDYRLTLASQVIRRRVGGTDEGWHLKLPGRRPDERIEVQLPLSRVRLPAEFRQQVAGTLAGAPLFPAAVLRTLRSQRELRDADGRVLATLATDRVRAVVAGRRQEWREAEVELVTGDVAFLDRVESVLTAAGVSRSVAHSKIGRALDRAITTVGEPDGSAGAAVLAYVGEQVGVLQELEPAVRVDAPDAVHRSRVATRRLRSALRTFAGVFVPGSLKVLRDELRWHAEELGAPRDAEVLRDRLLASVAELDSAEARLVAERIRTALDDVHRDAHAALAASMVTERYERLQLILEQLLGSPRRDQLAAEPADVVLPPLLDSAVHRVRRLLEHAEARPGDLTRWHEVRKAAKAARYGAELLVPVLGEDAENRRGRWEAVTEALGEVQDAVVAQRVIGDLAWDAAAEGLPRLPFDNLRHEQDRLLREALARGRDALAVALGLVNGP